MEEDNGKEGGGHLGNKELWERIVWNIVFAGHDRGAIKDGRWKTK